MIWGKSSILTFLYSWGVGGSSLTADWAGPLQACLLSSLRSVKLLHELAQHRKSLLQEEKAASPASICWASSPAITESIPWFNILCHLSFLVWIHHNFFVASDPARILLDLIPFETSPWEPELTLLPLSVQDQLQALSPCCRISSERMQKGFVWGFWFLLFWYSLVIGIFCVLVIVFKICQGYSIFILTAF